VTASLLLALVTVCVVALLALRRRILVLPA
jgi:hypothetical protein